jgi:hypothetical protein
MGTIRWPVRTRGKEHRNGVKEEEERNQRATHNSEREDETRPALEWARITPRSFFFVIR